MRARTIFFAAALAALLAAGPALAQGSDADALRATKTVGEQSDGYLGLVSGAASADIKARMDQVNIQRRALYTRLAGERGVTVSEAGAATACQLLSKAVDPGEYWRDEEGAWRQRAAAPVPLPSFCPR